MFNLNKYLLLIFLHFQFVVCTMHYLRIDSRRNKGKINQLSKNYELYKRT